MRRWLALYVQGIVMGIADLIPGVSGGTVAFITGIHPTLLKSLKTLNFAAIKAPNKVAWFVLSAITLGILSSITLGSHAIFYLLNQSLSSCLLRALFMGLVIGSFYFCFRKITSWNVPRILCLVFGCLVALAMSYFSHGVSKEPTYDVPLKMEVPASILEQSANYEPGQKRLKAIQWSHLQALYQDQHLDADTWVFSHQFNRPLQVESCIENDQNSWAHIQLIACGALSISAMILPGISGNQVMQIMGLYEPIIEAISTWTAGALHGSWINPSFWILVSVGIGILLGVGLLSRFLTYIYQTYFLATLSLMGGFMLGSLASLWPFWETAYNLYPYRGGYRLALQRISPVIPSITSYQTGLALMALLVGFTLIVMLEKNHFSPQLQLLETN